MKTVIFSLISTFLFLSSCSVKQVDYLAVFYVRGFTFDTISKSPIASVSVYFIDEGLSDARDKRKNYRKIGESNQSGEIYIEFEYFWGRKESLFHRKSETKYSIELVHHDFQTKRISFFEEKDRSNERIQINIGTIDMSPIKK